MSRRTSSSVDKTDQEAREKTLSGSVQTTLFLNHLSDSVERTAAKKPPPSAFLSRFSLSLSRGKKDGESDFRGVLAFSGGDDVEKFYLMLERLGELYPPLPKVIPPYFDDFSVHFNCT